MTHESRMNKVQEMRDLALISGGLWGRLLKDTVDRLTALRVMTTSYGELGHTNLNEKDYGFTLYPGRVWEYGSILELTPIEEGMSVLDLGGVCSPLVYALAIRYPNTRIVSLDLSSNLVDYQNQVVRDMLPELKNLQAVQGDMAVLPFFEESFDVVISISVLEHMDDENKAKAMREMGRVVKTGGGVSITFDFGRTQGVGHYPLRTLRHISDVVVKPSGLVLRGDGTLYLPSKIQCFEEHFRPPGWKKRLAWYLRGRPMYTTFRLFLEKSNSS